MGPQTLVPPPRRTEMRRTLLFAGGMALAAAVPCDYTAPVERPLQSSAVNQTANPPLAKILDQARGEKVEVALQPAGAGQPAALTGTVVGVEAQRQRAGKDAVVDVSVLNL